VNNAGAPGALVDIEGLKALDIDKLDSLHALDPKLGEISII